MLRGEVLTALAIYGHDLTLDEASRRFHAFLEERNTSLLPPDIRKVVHVQQHLIIVPSYLKPLLMFIVHYVMLMFIVHYVMQAAYVGVMQRVSASNRSDYESLLRVYRESDLSQEKTRVLSNSKFRFIF